MGTQSTEKQQKRCSDHGLRGFFLTSRLCALETLQALGPPTLLLLGLFGRCPEAGDAWGGSGLCRAVVLQQTHGDSPNPSQLLHPSLGLEPLPGRLFQATQGRRSRSCSASQTPTTGSPIPCPHLPFRTTPTASEENALLTPCPPCSEIPSVEPALGPCARGWGRCHGLGTVPHAGAGVQPLTNAYLEALLAQGYAGGGTTSKAVNGVYWHYPHPADLFGRQPSESVLSQPATLPICPYLGLSSANPYFYLPPENPAENSSVALRTSVTPSAPSAPSD